MMRNGSLNNDYELWHTYIQGSRSALDQLFERYAPMMLVYGKRFTGDEDLISDCIQDVFFDIWIKKEGLSSEVENVRSYLITCFRRKILRRMTMDQRFLCEQAIHDNLHNKISFSAETLLIDRETRKGREKQLKQAIGKLSKRQQEALYLKYFLCLSYKEIGVIMHTEVKSVYNLIGKSIASLREIFRDNSVF